MVELLIERGANVNNGVAPQNAPYNGQSLNRFPLAKAVDNGVFNSAFDPKYPEIGRFGFVSARIISMLLSQGANANVSDEYGYTPLMYAVRHPRGDRHRSSEVIARMLLRHGANPETPIGMDMRPELYVTNREVRRISAIQYVEIHKVGSANALLRDFVDAQKRGFTWPNKEETKAMLEGVGTGMDTAEASFPLPNNAKRALEKRGMVVEPKALSDAAIDGDENLVRLLLAAGVDPEAKGYMEPCAWDPEPCTATEWAAVFGQHEVTSLLLGAAASKDQLRSSLRPKVLEKILVIASCIASPDLARVALENGADPAKQMEEPPLSLAVGRGHTELVRLLLQRGASAKSVSRKDLKDNRTLLMKASGRGYLTIMDLLLKHGDEVNARSDFDETPLSVAISENRIDAAKLLLDKGANVNERVTYGMTAMGMAIVNNSMPAVLLLKERGAKTDINLGLVVATYSDNVDEAIQYLEKGADPNFVIKGKIGHYDKESEPPLLVAARKRNTKLVNELIRNSANASLPNRQGLTPLMEASRLGEIGIVRALLEWKADVNGSMHPREEAYVASPLHYAAAAGHLSIVELLVSHGANIEIQSKVPAEGPGGTPLMWAVSGGHFDVVQYLIERGADVNATDYTGAGPLTTARRKNDIRLINLLETAGAKDNSTGQW